MRPIWIGDIGISSIIERDGPWRRPSGYFPEIDPALIEARLAELDPIVYDRENDMLVVTYQSFIVRTRHPLLSG